MAKRYTIATESILEGCLVTPDVYEGILERFEAFVAPFIKHLHPRTQQQKAIDYMKGLLFLLCHLRLLFICQQFRCHFGRFYMLL